MELDCATELRLGPPGTSSTSAGDHQTAAPKRPSAKRTLDDTRSEASGTGSAAAAAGDEDQDTTTAAKAQVVGWPPVRASRRNTVQAAAKKAEQLFVKVSMDGAPYLRKVDLRMCKGYRELREALDVLFFTKSSSSAAADQLAVAYEDKDGDLMLVGDVPWDMFISSCKKLRIMKGSEAR